MKVPLPQYLGPFPAYIEHYTLPGWWALVDMAGNFLDHCHRLKNNDGWCGQVAASAYWEVVDRFEPTGLEAWLPEGWKGFEVPTEALAVAEEPPCTCPGCVHTPDCAWLAWKRAQS